MEPVVNGINEAYSDQIDFRWLDANSKDGGAAFKYYKLVGHPGYVILDPNAKVLWSGVGDKSEAELTQQITASLAAP